MSSSEEERRASGSDEEEASEEEEYVVEKILDKGPAPRGVNKGKLCYLIKWKGYDEKDASWELIKDTEGCQELVEEFERSQAEKERQREERDAERKRKKAQKVAAEREKEKENPKKKKRAEDRSTATAASGFDRGLKAVDILGATDSSGELAFLVKFQGEDEPELIPSRVANVKSPQLVIKFYESHLSWSGNNN